MKAKWIYNSFKIGTRPHISLKPVYLVPFQIAFNLHLEKIKLHRSALSMRNCFLTICNNLSQEMHANFKHRKCYDNNIYWHASCFHCIFVKILHGWLRITCGVVVGARNIPQNEFNDYFFYEKSLFCGSIEDIRGNQVN